MTLAGRDFMKLLDFSKEEIQEILNVAKRLKKEKKEAVRRYPHGEACAGKNIVLIFEKASTRTRCAFEVAAADLGVHSTMLDVSNSQMGKKESIEDTARVLSTMYDGIMYRGYSQEGMEEFARYSSVPVWNALSDRFHPTQLLADLLTIEERFGKLKGLKLCYMGDARFNMGNSYMVACAKMGMHFVACTKEGYFPDEDLISECQQIAEENGGSLRFTESVAEGCKDADIICTDVWLSMGEPESLFAQRIADLQPYQVNDTAFSYAKESAIFLHCLPAFHNARTEIGAKIYKQFGISEMEVSDSVFESERSLVFAEAENRMHTIKALLYLSLGGA